MVPGLKQSFANLLEKRGMNIDNSTYESLFEIPGYTVASDGKYYKYNLEVDGKYYCPGNIVISDGEARQVIEPEKGILIDNYLLDLENKKIELADSWSIDSFIDGLQNIDKIKVEKAKDEKGKIIEIYLKEKENSVIIGIDDDNQITRYENQYLREVGSWFLENNQALTQISLPQLQKVGDGFLFGNQVLTDVNLPQIPELEGRLKKIAARNQITKKEIAPTDIAILDKESELTTSEIESAQKIIEKASHESQKISEEEKDVSR